jgi:GGDEF domain-containing protein
MAIEGFLGRVLTDPTTGLPNIPYFRLIRDWEERRASRRGYSVRVLRITVSGGDDRIRRSLSWRLCREFRSSDLIASEGSAHFRVLLTSPDAEQADAIQTRIVDMATELNQRHPTAERLELHVEVDSVRPPATLHGPCDPCDPVALEHSGEGEAIDFPPASTDEPGR